LHLTKRAQIALLSKNHRENTNSRQLVKRLLESNKKWQKFRISLVRVKLTVLQ